MLCIRFAVIRIRLIVKSFKFKLIINTKTMSNTTIPKSSIHNYIVHANGAIIMSNSSSPLSASEIKKAQNVLTQNIRQVWLSDHIPTQFTIDLRNLNQRPQNWNRVGFYCWNELTSNPKLIQISYKSTKQNSWQIWSKLKIQLKTGWQEYPLTSIGSNKVKFVRVSVLQNYSENDNQERDQTTYLNAVMLGNKQDLQQLLSDNPSGIMHRQKTFSDYRKLTSSQKQLKKMQEKIRNLTSEHDIMKKTIDQQSSIILKLQQTIQSLTDHVDKLYINQEAHETRLKKCQKQRQQHIPPQKVRDFFNDESEIVNKVQYNRHQKQKNLKHPSRELQEIPQSKNSSIGNKRKKQVNANHEGYRKQQKSMKRQVIHLRQSDSLSEYQDPLVQGKQRMQRSGRNSDKSTYKPMLQKLTRLLKLKQQKKRQIRSQRKSRRTHQHTSDQDEQLQSQIQYQYRH